ncbi:YezD family protein [Alicyclobacillus fructus]|uniref:YezD family protein n=1 Tax=Alicyclobacillus fructus TaxID=2816082 RepID=UPI001A8D6171|nr:YezD family protein [Alicyclobacillus fructus]
MAALRGEEQRPPKWLESVQKALEGMSHGSVEIVVHQGQVVQINRLEKWRFSS